MFAPAVPELMIEFGSTSTFKGTFVVSVYVLGQAIGPLLAAPMSELYGRQPAYLISNILFVVFTVACAVSSNLNMLIGFRFLAGCAGATPTTIGGATIGDIFAPDKRGGAMAVWGMGVQLGPALGPLIGGFLSQAKGWRWVFWLQTIVGGVVCIFGMVFMRETYAVVLLERKTQRLIKETGNHSLRSSMHINVSTGTYLRQALVRPCLMVVRSPIIQLLGLYTAILFGYLYLFIATFPDVFQGEYHFSVGISGLAYLGLGVGSFLGLVLSGKTSDLMYVKLRDKNNGVAKPEYRLPPLMATSPLICIAFFWYGWSAESKTHWIVPILGTTMFSIGMMPTFVSESRDGAGIEANSSQMCINMYLVDTYARFAASALAASKLLQSVTAAFLPLAGRPLYQHLGLGWGNSVLAFIALAMIPIPWAFFRYGEALRTKFKVSF